MGIFHKDFCSKCEKEIGFGDFRRRLKDGSLLHYSCYKKLKIEENEQNKEIMYGYVTKYLSNQDMGLSIYILSLDKNEDTIIDDNSLEDAKEHFQSLLQETRTSSKKNLSSYEVDDIISTTKMCGQILDFLDDLEKMYKLFQNKGIGADYHVILSIFADLIEKNIHKEYDKLLIPAHKRISKRLGNNITIENVIKEFMKIPIGTDNNLDLIIRLLDKFNLKYEQEEVEKLTETLKEQLEIERFEQNLGSKKKTNLGDFTELNGYEFQEYLKNLFKLLGYTVIETKLSGDQGADLIIKKDDEKTVVQAKKYEGKVTNEAIQEVVAAKNHYKADKTIVVTTSSFTRSAIDLALSNNVELWDGQKLKDTIKNLSDESEDKSLVSQKMFYFKKGTDIQNAKIKCPFCEEEFNYKIDKRSIEAQIKCPHCEVPLKIDAISRSWRCESCNKKFGTKEEAERHEKVCDSKNE